MSVILIACSSQKLRRPTLAKRLYVSTLFSLCRKYAEKSKIPWYIISAKHGLLSPSKQIAPYNQTLNAMPIYDRRLWASEVFRALQLRYPIAGRVILLCGFRYREFLEPMLIEHGWRVESPLAGLTIGKQLKRLKFLLKSM